MSKPQQPLVTIPDTEQWTLSSSNINQEFSIFVALPYTYGKDNQTYPVMYVLDANSVFGIVTGTVRLLDFFNELREVIIVGIGYPDVSTFKATMGFRTRDLTPTENSWYETKYKASVPDAPEHAGEGKAAQFLQFMSKELMPFINTNYRTLPEDNALVGFSFGGLFALYTLFNQPGIFKCYLVGSPSIWWDNEMILKLENDFAAKNSDLTAWLFMSVGGEEPDFMIADMYKMANVLRGRKYKGLEMTTHFFEGDGHMSVFPSFISRGLRAAFARKE